MYGGNVARVESDLVEVHIMEEVLGKVPQGRPGNTDAPEPFGGEERRLGEEVGKCVDGKQEESSNSRRKL